MKSPYQNGEYLSQNPAWHLEDSPEKARAVLGVLRRLSWTANRVLDVGCGAGGVLAALQPQLPASTELSGWDLSPQALALAPASIRSQLHLGDPVAEGAHAELALCLDVFEHLADDVAFLRHIRPLAPRFIFRIPLDLSVLDILRPHRLLQHRERYGHLHAYTREIALHRLKEAGYNIVHTAYHRIPVPIETPRQQMMSRLRSFGHRLLPDLTADLLGGTSLMVAAQIRQ